MASDTIGYGNPPPQRQFKKGQSGNRKGRPRLVDASAGVQAAILRSTVHVQENGKSRKVPIAEAAAKRLLRDAIKGDPKSLKQALRILGDHPAAADESHREQLRAMVRAAWDASWWHCLETLQAQEQALVEARQALAAQGVSEDTVDAILGLPGLPPDEASSLQASALVALRLHGVPDELIDRLPGVRAAEGYPLGGDRVPPASH